MGLYLQSGRDRHGPYDEADLRAAYERGEHAPETMSWAAGERAWIPLGKRWGGKRRHRFIGVALACSLVVLASVAVGIPTVDAPWVPYFEAPVQAAIDAVAMLFVLVALWRYVRGAGPRERPRAMFAGVVFVTLSIAGGALLSMQWRVDRLRGTDPDAIMTLSDDARVLRIEGAISTAFVADFENALARAPALERIDIDSPGGLVDDAMQVATAIAERGIRVRGVGECASACVLLWAAAPERELEVSSYIGLHQVWADEELPSEWRREAIELHEPRSVELLKAAGFSAALLAKRAQTPADDIAWVDALQLLDEGVRFTAVASDGTAMTPAEVRAYAATRTDDPNQKGWGQ